jgi:hypothetical protein
VRLHWSEFKLWCEGGTLTFTWTGSCVIEVGLNRCVSSTLGPPGPDGASQWVFHFREPQGPPPGLIVVRVDVPARWVQGAEEFVAMLERDHGIQGRRDEAGEDADLERIPLDVQRWTVAPAGQDSEELFRDVMARIASDPG